MRRGYTEEQIAKIWGGNLLRVWREVERVAAELQRNASSGTQSGAATRLTAPALGDR